jgi:hypothetical protein
LARSPLAWAWHLQAVVVTCASLLGGKHFGAPERGGNVLKGEQLLNRFATRPLREHRSPRDQHTGEIEAGLAATQLAQSSAEVQASDTHLFPERLLICDGSVSVRSTFVMSS